MTLTLELSPEEEARLRTKAAVRGQEIKEYLLTLAENDTAIDLSEFEDQADFDASVAGISEGLADIEAGRTFSVEETFAHLREHRAERRRARKAQENLPSQTAAKA